MSSKAIEPKSIAFQLVVLFTLAATFVLSCGLGIFYWMVVRHAFEEDNAVLADKAFALNADLKQSNGLRILDEELKSVRAGEHWTYWIRMIDSKGRVLSETLGMDRVLPSGIFPPAAPPASALAHPKDYRRDGQLFSLIAFTARKDNDSYTIQLAQDRSTDEEFTKRFGGLLVIVLAVGFLASAAIATTVARRGLRPLTQMTRSLERIGPSNLSQRVASTGWPRELQPLAAGFDQMLDRLENSFTRLSQFSADLAHELRTPIANILGNAQVTLTRARSSDEYREVLESALGECERLSGIVDNLLFLARADAAREQIERTLFDGRAEIEKIAAYYRNLAEERDITMTCTGEGDVYADPVLFGRAVSNLVDNALRFTSDKGTIEIAVANRANQSEVAVSDNGSGIPAEHLPKVFDRFYRADPSRSSGGAGLGLALVKSITELHGGSAEVRSTPGQGTTFLLLFPRQV